MSLWKLSWATASSSAERHVSSTQAIWRDPGAQKKTWYAEKMGTGLCRYHEQPLILCCAAVCSRTLHPVGIHWGMCLSLPFIQLYALNQIHSPKANPGCSLKEHSVCCWCCTYVCPGSNNLGTKYLSNVRHLQKCWLFLQQWSGEELLCLQPCVQKPLTVSLGLSIKEERAAPSTSPHYPTALSLARPVSVDSASHF